MPVIIKYITSIIKFFIMNLYVRGCSFVTWCRYSITTDFGFNKYRADSKLRKWLFVGAMLLMLLIYYTITIHVKPSVSKIYLCLNLTDSSNTTTNDYKYILINGTEVAMADHEIIKKIYNSYIWFESMKHLFKNLGETEAPTYPKGTPTCKLDMLSMGPITVNKTLLKIGWVEKEHPHVKRGGFYAPAHCRSPYRIAIFVPYRNFTENLNIFLYYVHRLMKIHLLEYRIFIMEQFGADKFNRGTLFNIAYLESQRFGTWDCLIFHDVDAIPKDDRILYSCSKSPFHFASAVEQFHYNLRYEEQFGCVTALTPAQFEAVNGYSNFYWSWGGEDDDMSARLKFTNLNISRYHVSIGRYASLPHQRAKSGRAK